jgi:hypothetical protein
MFVTATSTESSGRGEPVEVALVGRLAAHGMWRVDAMFRGCGSAFGLCWEEDDAVAVACGRVLSGGAFRQSAKPAAGLGELSDATVEVGEALVDEGGDVFAWVLAVVGDHENLADLCERESGGLGVADEIHAVDGLGWVVAIPRRRAVRVGQEPGGFPEADGLGGDTRLG